MKNLYANFDGLDLSFHGRVSDQMIDALDKAKIEAQELRGSVSAEIGGLPVMVRETGRRGGWAYVFDTGEDGEVWACMGRNEEQGRWVLTVSVRSAAFLQYGGLEAIRARIAERLECFEFEPIPCPQSGLVDSVSRVDFCCDFLCARNFEINPEAIASKGSKKGHLEGASVFWAGRRITGVTVGKMPNRQVVIYDKTTDTRQKGKDYWFEAWGLDRETEDRVWRVELRAGKKFLRETWGVKSLDDLAASVGDIMTDTLDKVRLVDLVDSNVTRCPDAPLWAALRKAVADGLRGLFSGLCPGVVRETVRERFDLTMRTLVKGCALTHAAVLVGRNDLAAICDLIEKNAGDVIRAIKSDAEETLKHVARARDRYRMLGAEEWAKRNGKPAVPEWLSARAT